MTEKQVVALAPSQLHDAGVSRLLRSLYMEELPPTEMIYYACRECDMDAQGVVTEAMSLAWLHHMESHGPLAQYDSWAWEIVPLRFQTLSDDD